MQFAKEMDLDVDMSIFSKVTPHTLDRVQSATVNIDQDGDGESDITIEGEVSEGEGTDEVDTQTKIDFTDAVKAELSAQDSVNEEGHIVVEDKEYLLEEGYAILIGAEESEGEALAVDLYTETGGDVSAAVEYLLTGGGMPEEETEVTGEEDLPPEQEGLGIDEAQADEGGEPEVVAASKKPKKYHPNRADDEYKDRGGDMA
jgi:hypothetical protein